MKNQLFFKKLCAWIMIMALVISNITITFAKNDNSQEPELYYNENFDTGYAIGGPVSWTPRNASNATTTLKVEADNKVLKLNQASTVGSSQWFSKILSEEGLIGKYTVKFRIKASAADNTFVFLTDSTNTKTIAQLCIRENSYFCMDTGDGFPWNHKVSADGGFKADTWFDVEFVVDTNSKSYTISVDNGEAYKYSFREVATNLGAFRIGCGGSTKDIAYIDDILVETSDDTNGTTMIYSEDFESKYVIGENVLWTPRNAGNTTTTLKVESSNNAICVKQPSTVGSSQWFTNIFNTEGITKKVEMSFKIKASEAANTFVFLTDSANSKSIAQLCIRENSYFCLDTSDGFPWNHKITADKSFEKNNWYSVKFIVDIQAQSFQVSVDDGEVYTYAFREKATNLGGLRIGCGSSTTDEAYLDDVIVKDYVASSSDDGEKGEKVMYSQNFESGDVSEWTNPTNTSGTVSIVNVNTIDEITDKSALNVLKVNKTVAGNGSYLVNKDLLTTFDSGVVTVQVKMMSNSANSTSYYLLTDSNNNAIAQFGLYDSRGIAYQVGSNVNSYKPYEINKWYAFKLVFDTEAKVYHIYVDNELIASDIEYTNKSDISRIRLGIYNYSTGTTYYDDINILQDTRDREITTQIIPTVTTLEGVEPVLPTYITCKDSYGFSHKQSVIWDTIQEDDYQQAGQFILNGILEDNSSISITINVKKNKTEVQYSEDFENNSQALDS